jgi:hypothetical protein
LVAGAFYDNEKCLVEARSPLTAYALATYRAEACVVAADV